MEFEIVGEIEDVRVIARGPSVRERLRLRAQFGRGTWRKLKGMATILLPGGVVCRAELHWYEAHGVGRRKMKIKRFWSRSVSGTKGTYVVCLRNDGAEDLEVRKLYQVVPDDTSAGRGYLRVIDESGEDYLYPEELFGPVAISEEVERVLVAGAAPAR